MDNKNNDKEREEFLDILKDIFTPTSYTGGFNKIDKMGVLDNTIDDYIDILSLSQINSFNDCFIEGYDNVVSLEKYRTYKYNKEN